MNDRGNPDIIKGIYNKIKSKKTDNVVTEEYVQPRYNLDGGGAAASLYRYKKNATLAAEGGSRVNTIDVSGYLESLKEDFSVLPGTGNYYTIVRNLLALYAAGELSKMKLMRVPSEDMSEIMGIVRDFEATLSSAFKR